jgi:hypothetical protein
MSRITATDIERHYFEQFRRDFAIPAGEIQYSDKPDVRIVGSGKIGLEIARLYIVDGTDPSSEQVQYHRRERVVALAQELHKKLGGLSIELNVDFNPGRPILEIQPVAEILAQVAIEIQDESQTRVWNPPSESDYLRYVHHNGIEYPDAKWCTMQSFSIPSLNIERLQYVVNEKTKKAAEYERCDEYWLLLVVDFMGLAQDQTLALPREFRLSPNAFSKVLIYKPQVHQVLQVPK